MVKVDRSYNMDMMRDIKVHYNLIFTHTCLSELCSLLVPSQSVWTNAGLMLIGPFVKFQWKMNHIRTVFGLENEFENVLCKQNDGLFCLILKLLITCDAYYSINNVRLTPNNLPLCLQWCYIALLSHITFHSQAAKLASPLGSNTLRARQNGQPFCRGHFQIHFLEWEILYFQPNFIDVCSQVCTWQQASIDSDNGLASNTWQAILWTNGGLTYWHIEGILPKGPYPPCLRMADKALLAGYPRHVHHVASMS